MKMIKLNRVLSFPIVIVLLVLSAVGQSSMPGPLPTKDAGFKLKGLDGKFYDTSATGGDVWVVSFGATWCTPCTWELVAIEELKDEYAKKAVKFLWVSIEDTKLTSNNLLKHYAKERQLTIPVLRDPKGEAFSQFSASTRIPVVVFFDGNGRYVAPIHRGMSSEISEYKKMVRARVDALLRQKGEMEPNPSMND